MSKYTVNSFGRIPLNLQPGFQKAQENPSYESFAPAESKDAPKPRYQPDSRPGTHMMSVMRRNPDGTLDFDWAKNMCIDGLHNLEYPHALQPIQHALLSLVLPDKLKTMDKIAADMMTKLSDSEKSKIRSLVEAHMAEEENWNVGQGGGSVEGRSRTRF